MPTAPGSVNPITSPGLPRTGDQPGKGSETPLTPDEQKKLADSLASQGKQMFEKKLNAYREGKATREETLEGTAGDQRAALSRVLDGIDRARMGSGGVFGGSGSNYSAALVKDIWRLVDVEGGVNGLQEDQVRLLTGMTQQALKDPNLSAAERGDLQNKLAGALQAQQQFHKARTAPAKSMAETASARAPRRTLAERTQDISQKNLIERFDNTNVTTQFVSINRNETGRIRLLSPAKDSDRLMQGSPATVGDVKRLLGGLNNSIISIEKNTYEPTVTIKVESNNFRNIQLTLTTATKGIAQISVDEISAGSPRRPQRDVVTNEVINEDLSTRRRLIGALLALKIAQYAESNNIGRVEAIAAFNREEPGSKVPTYQGAQFWLNIGLDGRLGMVGEAELKAFLKTHPDVEAKWVNANSITSETRVLDLVADSAGNLIPEHVKFWRQSPIEYRGSIDLRNHESKSYVLYQRALKEFGLK